MQPLKSRTGPSIYHAQLGEKTLGSGSNRARRCGYPQKRRAVGPGTPINSPRRPRACPPVRAEPPHSPGARRRENCRNPVPQPRAATKPAPPPHSPAGSCRRLHPEDIRSRSRIGMGAGVVSVPHTSGPDPSVQAEDPVRRRGAERLVCKHRGAIGERGSAVDVARLPWKW